MSRILYLNEKPYYKVEGLKVWKGQPTDMRLTWICYYVSIRELMNELLDHRVIHYDDIQDYICEEYEIPYFDGETENYDELNDKVSDTLNGMSDDEIECMISTFTGNAYYQTFENAYETEDEED